MAHLITHHDPYHVHKVLGLLVLLHYIYRFYLLCATGRFFPPDEPPSTSIPCVLLHGLLSWSSLLLPLPKVRNFNKPMIWPEFRLHSIVFATRHVLTTVASLANLWPADDRVVANALARAVVVLGTVRAASYVTDRYGCRENRTTNAMPYPEGVAEGQQLAIKRLYTSAQFGATVTALMNDPTMNFAPLLGIQMAPLLMTLVRKGKISTGAYHRVYSTSLSLGYVAIFVRLLDVDPDVHTLRAVVLFGLPFKKCRQYMSARTFWSVAIAASCVAYPLWTAGSDGVASPATLRMMVWLALARTMANQALTYAPLFLAGAGTGTTSKQPWSRAAALARGALCGCGLRGMLWACGLFCIGQCFGPKEV